jgi:hypothetical protein
MKKATFNCLIEGYRRWILFNKDKPAKDVWAGLGTSSQYNPAIKDGYMKWVEFLPPMKRQVGWLKLTDSGVDIIEKIKSKGIGKNDFNDLGDFISPHKLSHKDI